MVVVQHEHVTCIAIQARRLTRYFEMTLDDMTLVHHIFASDHRGLVVVILDGNKLAHLDGAALDRDSRHFLVVLFFRT